MRIPGNSWLLLKSGALQFYTFPSHDYLIPTCYFLKFKRLRRSRVDEEGVFISNQEDMKTRGVISLSSSVKYLYSPVKHHYLFAEPWFDLTLNSIVKPGVGPPRQMLRYGLKIGYRIQF